MILPHQIHLPLALLTLPFLWTSVSAHPISNPPSLKPRQDPSDPSNWNTNSGPWSDPSFREHYGSPPPIVTITAPAPPSPPPLAPPAQGQGPPPSSGPAGGNNPSGSGGGKGNPLVCTQMPQMPQITGGKTTCVVDGKGVICEGIWRKQGLLRDLLVCMTF